ncbi:MAG: transcriptional regulator [Verrucomicrobiae bacterium]|nr:transcriptional regulator [Verrucomicrobiae bacterium]
MRDGYPEDQLHLAAHLYYLDGIGQEGVAQFLGVSQAKVSRMLALARERGIVRISVAAYEPRDHALEQELCKRFGLTAAAVIKTPKGASVEEARRLVGHFGAPFVLELIPPESTVALAGGRTMRELIESIPNDKTRRLTVVQAMGSVDYTVGPADAFELGRQLASRTGGHFFALNTPAYVPDKRARDLLLAHEQIRGLWKEMKQAKAALVGIGTLDNSVFVERGVYNATDRQDLRNAGAVGEICGRFYDASGHECDTPWRNRVMSIELELVRRIPQVIAVVTGADRAAALAAAIRGRLVKAVLIDDTGASALLSAGLTKKKTDDMRTK